MSLYSCDYDSIVDYQSGKNQKKVLTYLWNKYQPLVIASVRKYFNYSQNRYDFEDCIHECFFQFPHVIEKQNMSKVNHREMWSFGHAISMYLEQYTKVDMRSSTSEMYKTTYTSSYEETREESYVAKVPLSLISTDIVDTTFENTSVNIDLSEIVRSFYSHCTDAQKILLKICLERNTTSEKRNRAYYIQKASKLKKGHCTRNRGKFKSNKNTITAQYFHQEVRKLKRGFISHMQQYGYYTPSSLKAMGLEKLI